MIFVVIAYSLVFFILGFKLALYGARKYIKDVSREVETVYNSDCDKANAFYDRIYNHFLN